MSTEASALPIAPGRFTKITKGVRRDLVEKGLPPESLFIVTNLAAEGCREPVIRDTIGCSPAEWRTLLKPDTDGEPSALRCALDTGLATGASEVITLMRAAMRAGDTKAASWLGEKVYRIGAEDNQAEAPRVQIILNAALSPDEYERIINASRPAISNN